MKALEYIKMLAQKTRLWYKELGVDGISVNSPTREEWATHFNVSPKLWEHVLLEMDN